MPLSCFVGPVIGGSRYCCTFTWKPAAFRALTSSAASKLPLTVNELALGLAVSLLTPSTFLTVSLIALLQAPQQLWTPATVSLVTLPGVTPLSSLIANVLLPVSP